MDFQAAEKVDCSSKDLIRSVARNLRFYIEVQRREDGFDTSPTGIPRMLFPKLLPRPMLISTPQDISLKHHFSHAQVRCALVKIQSSKIPPKSSKISPRKRDITKSFNNAFRQAKFDHPLMLANEDYNEIVSKELQRGSYSTQMKGSRQLRDGLRMLKRASPPTVKPAEMKRLLESSRLTLLAAEVESHTRGKRYIELGNTKLQSFDREGSLQRSFMAPIHKAFVSPRPLTSQEPSVTKVSPRNRFVYDINGRRHKVVLASA